MNKYGKTALGVACQEGHLNVVKLLVKKGFKGTIKDKKIGSALISAAYRGHADIVKLLCLSGVDPNTRGQNGNTALISASSYGHVDTVQALVDMGANVNTAAPYGQTALMVAAGGGYNDIVKLLLEKGAEVNVKNVNGETPLIWASENGHVQVVQALLEHGADLDATDGVQWTALSAAVSRGHYDVVTFLLDYSADFNHKALYDWTPLLLAAVNGHTDVVRLLVREGADTKVKTSYGWTALICAAYAGSYDSARFLLEKGADIGAKNSKGLTALDYAKAKKHEKLVKLLTSDKPVTTVPGKPANTGNDCTIKNKVESLFCSKAIKVKSYYYRPSMLAHTQKRASAHVDLSADELEGFKKARMIVEKEEKGETSDMEIGWHDINNDGVLDIFIMRYNSLSCGADGCTFHILVSQPNGNRKAMFVRQLTDPPFVLASKHLGYNYLSTSVHRALDDITYNAISRFDGKRYRTLYGRTYKSYKGVDVSTIWMPPNYNHEMRKIDIR